MANSSRRPGNYGRGLLMVLGCTAGWIFLQAAHAEPTAAEKSETPSPESLEIHRSGFLFDGHNDLPWRVRELTGGSFEKCDIAEPQAKMHTDIPRIKTAGLKGQFWSVYVPANTMQRNTALATTLEQIDTVNRMIKKYPEMFEMADTADDIERIGRSGKVASMIGVEGGHSIEGSLDVLQQLYDRGARYMTLTHSKSLDWADSATDEPRSGGLSEFGRAVVREMNRMGMLVDLSHVSVPTMEQALDLSRAPIIFSHSSVRAICDHPRNVPDHILRRLPENGGVIMINFKSGFIVPTARLKEDPDTVATLQDVADHIDHAVRLAGVDHVGIGSDYDGIPDPPRGLEDVSTYPALTHELVKRGYSREDIHKILGENVLRVLRAAEKTSAEMQKE